MPVYYNPTGRGLTNQRTYILEEKLSFSLNPLSFSEVLSEIQALLPTYGL
jgi:hypothetical protein